MGYKTLELTLISAKDLKNVNLIGKMDVYVVVYLSDEPKSKQKTPVHQDGGTNPTWNYTMRFTIDDAASKYLVFQLKHEHTFGADKDLGEVHVPVKDLFSSNAPQFVTYQVKRSGKAKGELKFSFKFIDVGQNVGYDAGSSFKPSMSSSSSSAGGGGSVSKPYPPPPAGYPVDDSKASTAYPPPPQQVYGEYPPPQGQTPTPVGYPPQAPVGVPYGAPQGYPPQQPAGYGYPPQAGYGYPPSGAYPPQGGYPGYPPAGYPQPQAQKPQKQKKKKQGGGGFGMGAGLLGGLVGGLVLGEVLDDTFDGGFDDGGFDDGGFDGGFDF